MTLTEFLLARIAEDEAVARAADSSRWLAEDKGVTFEWRADDFHGGEAQARLTADTKANMWHISNWAPTRVLAECEAMRRIVEEVVPHLEHVEGSAIDGGMYDEDAPHAQRDLLLLLAMPYADHPDYREEWRP